MSIKQGVGYHMATVVASTDPDDPYSPPTVDDITLKCSAPPDAECRTYPDCPCEQFAECDGKGDKEGHAECPPSPHDRFGHAFESGRDCWIKQWFDVGPEAHCYVGDDATDGECPHVPAVARTGLIKVVGFDEWPEWEWSEDRNNQGDTT